MTSIIKQFSGRKWIFGGVGSISIYFCESLLYTDEQCEHCIFCADRWLLAGEIPFHIYDKLYLIFQITVTLHHSSMFNSSSFFFIIL